MYRQRQQRLMFNTSNKSSLKRNNDDRMVLTLPSSSSTIDNANLRRTKRKTTPANYDESSDNENLLASSTSSTTSIAWLASTTSSSSSTALAATSTAAATVKESKFSKLSKSNGKGGLLKRKNTGRKAKDNCKDKNTMEVFLKKKVDNPSNDSSSSSLIQKKKPLRDISNNRNDIIPTSTTTKPSVTCIDLCSSSEDKDDMSQKNESSSSSTSPSPHSLIRSSNNDDETSSTKKLLSTATSSSSTSSSTSSSSSNEKHGLDINDNGDDIVETDINNNSSTETELKNLIKQRKFGWMWNDRFDEFKEEIQSNGGRYPKQQSPIGTWVRDQRHLHHKKKLSVEKTTLLKLIGFEFTAKKSSEYSGVSYDKSSGYFMAYIRTVDGKTHYISRSRYETDAAKAHDEKAKELGMTEFNFASEEEYELAKKKELAEKEQALKKELEEAKSLSVPLSYTRASDEDKKFVDQDFVMMKECDFNQIVNALEFLGGKCKVQAVKAFKATFLDGKAFQSEDIAALFRAGRNPFIMKANGEAFKVTEIRKHIEDDIPADQVSLVTIFNKVVMTGSIAIDGERDCIDFLEKYCEKKNIVCLNEGKYGGVQDKENRKLQCFGVAVVCNLTDAVEKGNAALNGDVNDSIKKLVSDKLGKDLPFCDPGESIRGQVENQRKYQRKKGNRSL